LAARTLVVFAVPDADGGAVVLVDFVPVGVDVALDLLALGVVVGVGFAFTDGSGLGDGVGTVACFEGG
jgi:hypothetical protein